MARPREPIALIVAKGKKNLTKDEISERLATEPQPATDEIEAPDYLTAAQKKHFDKLAGQLEKICIMGETDCDTLARYVVAESMYEQAVKDTRAAHKQRPKSPTPDMLIAWADMMTVSGPPKPAEFNRHPIIHQHRESCTTFPCCCSRQSMAWPFVRRAPMST